MSTNLSTDSFPYTTAYVLELLSLNKSELDTLNQKLNISPRQDSKTGRLLFTHADIERLKKAIELTQQGIPEAEVIRYTASSHTEPYISPAITSASNGQSVYTPEHTMAAQPGPITRSSQDHISVMVEAVSQVKEGILKDLSRLLDDKLAGLDEVVVELIRCKSENDSLKKKIVELEQSKASVEQELDRFKPVQFGFYRKS